MYPSVISTLPDPQATDRLNSPSHSTLHRSENSAIEEIQNYVGTLASTAGSLTYDIRSPLSNGGGHIQTADKGGTGQTNFQKGDLLVGQSSSVLTKLAVGSVQGSQLVVDATTASGVRWSEATGSKVAIVSSLLQMTGLSSSTPIFTASVVGSTLGTSNAIRFTAAISKLSLATSRGVTFIVNYGNNSVLSFTGLASNNTADMNGIIQGVIIANGSDVSQKAVGTVSLQNVSPTTSGEVAADATVGVTKYMAAAYGTSSVVSSANQSLVITAAMTGANNLGSVIGQFIVVEKIA